MTVSEGLVFYKERIVVPKRLRMEMLKLLHEGHFGQTKTKLRAREVIYWPGINSDIERMIENCKICEKYRCANTKNYLMPHEISLLPFYKISADILDHGGKSYLCVVDYYSKWIEILDIKDKTANSALKPVFATHGIPHIFFF